MAKSYAQLTKKIRELQEQADAIRKSEVPGVISRINEAIAFYGITSADLKFNGSKSSPTASHGKVAKSAPKTSPKQYADGLGNSWSGRGPRPLWLRTALGTGKSLADLVVRSSATAPVSKSAPKSTPPLKSSPKLAAKVAKKMPAKYRDLATGSTWSGRGTQPTWLRAALAGGRKISEFVVETSQAPKSAADVPAATQSTPSSAKQPAPTKALKKLAKPKKAKAVKIASIPKAVLSKPLHEGMDGAASIKH